MITVGDGIATLTLNRPDSFNAMSPEMLTELATAMAWFADQTSLGGLIITGAGTVFCPGGDVNWFKKGIEDSEIDLVSGVRTGADRLHQAIVDLERVPYPVIAAINGPAAGAGSSLALACKIRICSEDAFLACACGRIGASPDSGMTYFLPRVVGASRALELLLEDPNVPAQAALDEGLVSEVVVSDDRLARAGEKATELATKSLYYVKTVKQLVHRSFDRTLYDHLPAVNRVGIRRNRRQSAHIEVI